MIVTLRLITGFLLVAFSMPMLARQIKIVKPNFHVLIFYGILLTTGCTVLTYPIIAFILGGK